MLFIDTDKYLNYIITRLNKFIVSSRLMRKSNKRSMAWLTFFYKRISVVDFQINQ
jgi:hypothetical protein